MKDAIRHLDQRFSTLRSLLAWDRPSKGWVRAIRNALGMTTKQMARRMNVPQQRISEFEKAEFSGNITMRSLERAASVLGCRVVYALVPDRSLHDILRTQAEKIALQKMASVQQTMSLENQFVESIDTQKEEYDKVVQDLLKKPARLWDNS
jgi:predicted DNA-binding mobile mystery protein A